MAYVIGITNNKGGVAKTTTAINIADGLAKRNMSTLLIDLTTISSIGYLVRDIEPFQFFTSYKNLTFSITKYKPYFDIVAGDAFSKILEEKIAQTINLEQELYQFLHNINYDFVLLDTAPSYNWSSNLAHTIADWIIIPTILDPYSMFSSRQTVYQLNKIQRTRDKQIDGYCLLPTLYELNCKGDRTQYWKSKMKYDEYLWEPIFKDNAVEKANNHRMTIWDCYPHSISLSGINTKKGNFGGYKKVIERIIQIKNNRTRLINRKRCGLQLNIPIKQSTLKG